jgi:hypothetical protein
MRKVAVIDAPAPVAASAPIVLDDDAVFSLEQLRQALGLRKRTLPREIRAGRLTVCKRAGRYFVFGSDIKKWLRGGALTKNAPGQAAT